MDFSTNILFAFLICCLHSLKVTSWAVDDDGCRTPDKGVGKCVPARECQPMISLLTEARRPLPFHVRHQLRAYACGYNNRTIKVCCPDAPIPIRVPQRRNVSNHGNLDLLPKECGYTGIPNKISGGEDAVLGQYPWMALLSYKTSEGPRFKCGGTVISAKYILTAAHCITHLKEPLLAVRVGEYDISKKTDCELQASGYTKCAPPAQDLTIEEIIPHHRFNTDYDRRGGFNDIGLIRVSTINLTTEFVHPICLPTEEARRPRSNYLTITGWGYTERGTEISNVLQKVSLPIIRHRECQKHYRTLKISFKQICTYGNKKDSCSGDSGGPLQTETYLYDDIRSVQYGIISFGGAVCGAGSYPGVYTRVGSYMYWILENIRP